MNNRWQRRCTMKVLARLIKYKEDGGIIRFIDPAIGNYEIVYYKSPKSQKPELSINVYDCCMDIFIDSKHKTGHVRCYCTAHAKDVVKEFLRNIADAEN